MKYIYILFLSLLTWVASAQNTVGIFSNTPESLDGYTLFTPSQSPITYLIDNCGERVHSWESQYRPAFSVYLLEDGKLLRTTRIVEGTAISGGIEILDWDSNVIWEYNPEAEGLGRRHHDVEILPNGNILMIVRDLKSSDDLAAVGSPLTLNNLRSEKIIEIQPDLVNGGATVVWEWVVWDHLVQEDEPSASTFGVLAENPGKININHNPSGDPDWLHMNSVDYHPELDQILLSVRNFNEIWIIDHSTTTAEAATSTGGNSGKGGELLYRWGNPLVYGRGTSDDRKLYGQHDATWITDDPENIGKIILYNNRVQDDIGLYSEIGQFEPPVDMDGTYTLSPTEAFMPAGFDWTYSEGSSGDFFSHVISGTQRLKNGNTLICEGTSGHFFEVNQAGDIVWDYVNPDVGGNMMPQGDLVTGNDVFRCTRLTSDYPGLAGRDLTPQGILEDANNYDCTIYDTTSSNFDIEISEVFISPNPAQDFINLSDFSLTGNHQFEVFNSVGQSLLAGELTTSFINIENLPSGLFIISIKSDQMITHTGKFLKQ